MGLQVRHPVANVSAEFEKIRPSMALTFPFELDDFQKEAVVLLEEVWSLLKSMHHSILCLTGGTAYMSNHHSQA